MKTLSTFEGHPGGMTVVITDSGLGGLLICAEDLSADYVEPPAMGRFVLSTSTPGPTLITATTICRTSPPAPRSSTGRWRR